jgi:glycosyltransferase involved in cell wall biosynthesis
VTPNDHGPTRHDLVYLVAVGVDDPRFAQAVEWCVDSLRHWGRFTGDIAVLSDTDTARSLASLEPDVRIVTLDVEQLVDVAHGRLRHERFQAARLGVHKAIDLDAYDTVMYLDADILAVRDIRPLFESVTEFRYAREFQPMSGPPFSDSLTDAEFAEARWRRGINSGTYVAPASDLPGMLEIWKTELDRSPNGAGYDQPALNAIVLRRAIAAAALPSMAVGFPTLSNFVDHFGSDTRLLHYCGAPHTKFDLMRLDYEWLRAGSAIEELPSAAASAPLDTSAQVEWSRPVPTQSPMTIALAIVDRTGVESHALVNRALARELERRGHRIIGDDPTIAGNADVVIHHTFMRDFAHEPLQADVPHVAVRTSDFGPHPRVWVDRINEHYDQLWVPTEWIRNHALRGGVDPTKIRVVPLGIDRSVFRPEGPLYDLPTTKSFRFLFVGGASIRKGTDTLLRGYCDAFGPDDDVTLVVKDDSSNVFYRDPAVADQIRRVASDPSMPEVIYIDEYLSIDDLTALYRSCDVGVWPYRAEGFLLPALESLACGTPTMIPAIGPTADFSNHRTSYLLPVTRVQVPYPRQFRMRLGFDIDVDEINILEVKHAEFVKALQDVAVAPRLELQEKAMHGLVAAHSGFGWEHAAEIADRCLNELVTEH